MGCFRSDLYSAGKVGGPAAVLLHMIPPHNTRKNYPKRFIESLVERGVTVLNLDRRGAGRSGGKAKDAYLGAAGRLDAKAAFLLLARHPCKLDQRRVAFIGASNGTTTALDFSLLATRQPELEWPRALVLLTGGSYTEKQTRISEHRELFGSIPMLFVYSDRERNWSVGLKSDKAAVLAIRRDRGCAPRHQDALG